MSGVMCCLYGVLVLLAISSSHWFNYAGFIVGGILIAAGVFLERLCREIKKIPVWLKIIIALIILAVLVHFSWFESKVISFANSEPAEDAEYMIILGAKVNGSRPSLEFQRRIDAALDYAREHDDLVIICTGGKGSDEDIPESLAAYNYLLANGIDESRLFREEKSTSTTENFLYAGEIIEALGSGCLGAESPDGTDGRAMNNTSGVIVVSSAFHLYRASIIAERAGFTDVSFLGSTGLKILEPHYYIREYAAYVRELL